MNRAAPLIFALGAGVLLLAFARRASAAQPVYYLALDDGSYEVGQGVPAAGDTPFVDWAIDWAPLPSGYYPPPELPAFDVPVVDAGFPLWGDTYVPPWFDYPLPELPDFGDEEGGSMGDPLANLRAFLDTIAWAEGTAGANGYRTMFGGGLFDNYADHPRIAHQFTDRAGRRLWTTAAGRYQFMAVSPLPSGGTTRVDTWDRVSRRLALPDFSPASQDAAATELIREQGALDDVRAGRFAGAVNKVRGVWASLPGAGYDQPERPFDQLASVYAGAGGAFA